MMTVAAVPMAAPARSAPHAWGKICGSPTTRRCPVVRGSSVPPRPIAAVLALDPQGWFPFTVAKWWAVLVVVLITATFAAASSARRATAPVPTLGRVTVWLSAGLLVLIGVSTITALDGLYAWIGTPIRHLGLLAWVVFASMFAVGRRVGTDGMARRAAVRGTVIAALALGIYCMVELMWRAPIEFLSNSSRLGGPFGSAAYLGAACCLLLPVAIGVACDTDEVRGWRLVGAAGSLTLAVAVLGSGSRAALVGLALAGVAVIVVRRRRGLPSTNLRAVAAGVFVLLVGVVVAIRTGVFERSAGLTSRFEEWRIATRAIADHGVIGVGHEGYRRSRVGRAGHRSSSRGGVPPAARLVGGTDRRSPRHPPRHGQEPSQPGIQATRTPSPPPPRRLNERTPP